MEKSFLLSVFKICLFSYTKIVIEFHIKFNISSYHVDTDFYMKPYSEVDIEFDIKVDVDEITWFPKQLFINPVQTPCLQIRGVTRK